MDLDADSGGWGRPRPKFSDLSHSMTPEHSDDDDNREESLMEIDNNNNMVETARRVAPLIDHPITGYAGAPLGELNQLYVSQGVIQGVKNCYTAWDNGMKSPHTLYTCVFTCPVSGEHFASGNWHNERGVTLSEQICWYNTKKYAMTAAAARTLDCLSLRRCHGTEKQPHQRCLDKPYLSSDDAPKLPNMKSDIKLPVPLSQAEDDANAKTSLLPPKRVLTEWYLSFCKKLKAGGLDIESFTGKMSPGNECYNAWSNQKNSPNTLFTAIYTCHLSGERFPSGKLLGKEGEYEEDGWYFDGTNLIPGDMLDDDRDQISVDKVCFVWYKTKKEATVAAAGRALDCMMHRDLLLCQNPSGAISDKRYCKELPYTVQNTPEMWKQVSQSVHNEGEGDDERPPFLRNEFLTNQLGVADLHCLIEGERDEGYWRMKYKECRSVDMNNPII